MIFLFPNKIIDENNSEWLYFENPIQKIYIDSKKNHNIIKEINKFFKILKENQKYYFCGFFSYELGNIFQNIPKKLYKKEIISIPLVYGGFFENFKIIKINHSSLEKTSFINKIQILEKYKTYKQNVNLIKELIYEGKVYQVNYTFPLLLTIYGNLENLFFHLWENQKSLNAGLIIDKNFYVLSLSPELFFEIKNQVITLKPMKGTKIKSNSLRENINFIQYLKNNPKEKAENAMIVDLIRNDIGKISKIGSVKVKKIFDIEIYSTIIQMVSIISANLKISCRKEKFWRSIFPSGSVTGAPKINVMKIINSLESFNRELYTGSIGYITPNNDAKFNVAIRTIFGNYHNAIYYTGSGITIDSFPKNEFYECFAKCKFIQNVKKLLKPKYIFTTLKFSGGILYFKTSHIDRLINTKKFFSIPISDSKIIRKIERLENFLKKINKILRIHFRIYSNGKIQIFLSPFEKKKFIFFKISSIKTNSQNIFLYYKTNNRNLYENELNKAKKENFDEVVFFNEEGYLTEGSYTNLIVKINAQFYTPPIQSGILNGIFRQKLIKKYQIKEKNITLPEFLSSECIYFINSVRGILKGIPIKS